MAWTTDEIAVLERAYQLFGDAPMRTDLAVPRVSLGSEPQAGSATAQYRLAVRDARALLLAASRTDHTLSSILAAAARDVATARTLTRQVLDEARADTAPASDTPAGQREWLRRRMVRLDSQRQHVVWAQQRANRWLAALRVLRYVLVRRGQLPTAPPNSRAGVAVRAAMSRLGSPYVWGAEGPNQFDCSGLIQWAYAQAGVSLDRTTYDQITAGVAVPRSQVMPGDLVFPHTGHVQLAIGNNQVIEAPYSGASVRISELGTGVVIRRPLP